MFVYNLRSFHSLVVETSLDRFPFGMGDEVSSSAVILQTVASTRSKQGEVRRQTKHIRPRDLFFVSSSTISHVDLLISKYLLIEHHLPSPDLSQYLIDDCFKASVKELLYLFPALGLLLERSEVMNVYVNHRETNLSSFAGLQ